MRHTISITLTAEIEVLPCNGITTTNYVVDGGDYDPQDQARWADALEAGITDRMERMIERHENQREAV